MSDERITEAPLQGRLPTAEELNLVDWARQSHRQSLRAVQESLRATVTLATALLAGSTAFFAQMPGPVALKALGALLLMGSLVVALFGSLPRRRRFRLECIEEIRQARDSVEGIKTRCLLIATGALIAAFACFLTGALFSAVG